MHYYQHHIGDFIKDTSFLTNEEIGIYLKLIWLYYDTEKPLPNNLFELSMKTNSRENLATLEGLLSMFFTLDENQLNWHHSRCDKEIEHYKQQLNTASKAGKASAAKRAINKSSTTVERPLNDGSTTVQLTNNQQPLTNNHGEATRISEDWFLSKSMGEWAIAERPDLDVRKEAEQFKDYWLSQPDDKAYRKDWFAVWRHWIRGCHVAKPNPADMVRITVPPSNLPDPALEKIKADERITRPPSLVELARMAELRAKA